MSGVESSRGKNSGTENSTPSVRQEEVNAPERSSREVMVNESGNSRENRGRRKVGAKRIPRCQLQSNINTIGTLQFQGPVQYSIHVIQGVSVAVAVP